MDKTIFINQQKVQSWDFKAIIIFGFFILFLSVDFVGTFRSIQIYATRYVYLSGVNILLICYLLYSKEYKKLIDFKNVKGPFILYGCFIILSGISFFGSTNLPDSIISFSYLLLVFSSTFLFCILIQEHKYLIKHLIFLVILIATFQSLDSFLALLKLAVTNFDQRKFTQLLKYSFGNINIHSASLTLKVSFLLSGFFFYDNWKKYLSLVGYFTSISLIVLISARAAFLSVFFVHIAFFVLYFLFFKEDKKSKIIKTVVVFALIGLSVVFANLYFKNLKNDVRFSSVQSRISQIKVNDENVGGSAILRLKLWQNGYQLTTEHPVFGIGIGNWKITDLPLEKYLINNSDVSLHPHNDFVEVTAETGILNGLVFILIFVSILIIALRNCKRSKELLPTIANLLCILLLINYVIDSFFNFPLYIPTSQVYLVLIFVFLFIGAQNSKKNAAIKPYYLVLFLAISSIAVSYVSYKVYESSVIIKNIKDKKKDNISIELSDLAGISEEATFINNYESNPFQEYFAQYYVRQKDYEKALVSIREITKINPYLGHDDWQMWRIHLDKKQYDSAYYFVNKAIEKRPRNHLFYKGKLDVLFAQKNAKEIIPSFNALKQYGTAQEEDYNRTVLVLNQLKCDPKEVAKVLDEGIKKFPNDTLLSNFKKSVRTTTKGQLAMNHLELAGKAFEENNNEEAIKHYLLSLKFDSDNKIVMQNLGIIYAKTGKEKKAIPYLLKALNYDRLNDGKTEYVLGVCYLKLSDKENACKYMEIAADKKYSNAAIFIKESCAGKM